MPNPNRTLLALALLIPLLANCQDTTWYDTFWKKSEPAQALYYRTKARTDSGYQVIDHYRDGKTQMSGLTRDDFLHVRNGAFRWYMQDGTPYDFITYAGA